MSIYRLLVVAMSLMVATINVLSAQIAVKGSAEYDLDKYAVNGKVTNLGSYFGLQTNCALMDWIDVSITKQPEHGKATMADKKVIAYYAKDNARVACNGKTVISKSVDYMPASDYKGTDEVVVELVGSDGNKIKYTYRITVK